MNPPYIPILPFFTFPQCGARLWKKEWGCGQMRLTKGASLSGSDWNCWGAWGHCLLASLPADSLMFFSCSTAACGWEMGGGKGEQFLC